MMPEQDWWFGWLAPYRGDITTLLGLLPIVLVVLGLLLAWRRSFCEVAILAGTAPFLWLTLQPGSEVRQVGGVSLVPFRDLETMPPYQVIGNLAIFAALGFFGPIRFPALRSLTRVLVLAAAGSIAIETAQYVLRIDRVSSIDDVLLNTTGAVLAAVLATPWWARARIRRPVLEC